MDAQKRMEINTPKISETVVTDFPSQFNTRYSTSSPIIFSISTLHSFSVLHFIFFVKSSWNFYHHLFQIHNSQEFKNREK